VRNPDLKRFVTLWDSFEALAIEVYRGGACDPDGSTAYRRLVAELRSAYPVWEEELRPHWQSSRIKGEVGVRDPFPRLLELEESSLWISNPEAFRLLPAAREAINRYLLGLQPAQLGE
jgi:hypothetical protein